MVKFGVSLMKGKQLSKPTLIGSSGDSLREAFGKTLVKLSKKYPSFVVFDADVAGGTGTHHFSLIQRDFINLMLAKHVCCSIWIFKNWDYYFVSIHGFCLRATEQIRLSIAYNKSNVKVLQVTQVGCWAGWCFSQCLRI